MAVRLRLNVILSLVLVLASTAFAQGQDTQRTATTTTNASVFASPNADQTPLRVAREGSILLLLEINGDWCRVEFQDPDYGRRIGYVQTRMVRIQGDAIGTNQPGRQTRVSSTNRQDREQRGDVAFG
jgi:hypothetical protein